jgi:hypothetical protein
MPVITVMVGRLKQEDHYPGRFGQKVRPYLKNKQRKRHGSSGGTPV